MVENNNIDWWLAGNQVWLNQVVEEIIEPDLPIIDPHHHLWSFFGIDYLARQFHADINSGHNIKKTVYVECGMSYLNDGADHLKSLGETEFVVRQAKQIEELGGRPILDGIVAKADLRLTETLDDLLNQHSEISGNRLKGIRHPAARAEYPEALSISVCAPEGLYENPKFREGLNILGRKGLSYDAWHYHYQNQAFTALARAVPETTLILDHFGTPLGVGPYANHRNEIFIQWKKDIQEMAKCENVVIKLGGLAMSDNGFGWENKPKPPTSDEFAAAQKEYYLYAIECFGTNRCMMESNFPVDRNSLSYAILINGQKKIVSDFSEDEKLQLFYGTAAKVYQL